MSWMFLTFAAIFWGGNYVVGHILVQYVEPYSLSLIRWGGTTILMFSLYWKTLRQQWSLFAENGVVNVLLAFSSANGGDKMEAFGRGDMLTIISALSWAFYCAFLRVKNKTIQNTAFVAFSSLVGTVIMIPVCLLHIVLSDGGKVPVPAPSWGVMAGMLYLIIFPSWLSYVFWNKGVALIGTTRSEIFTHLIPLSGGVMGIIFLHNTLHYYHVITLVLIVFGIICCSGGKGPKTAQENRR